MRKPREFRRDSAGVSWAQKLVIKAVCDSDSCGKFVAFYGGEELSKPKHLRDLSAWLLKAADWLEGEE